MVKIYSVEEVSQHNTPNDCWIILDGKVYDVTRFLSEHPGGNKVILKFAGKDASKDFKLLHNVKEVLNKYGPKLYIGKLSDGKESPDKTTSPELKVTKISSSSFGELVPYGDPNWYQDWASPYYNESHRRFRTAIREFVEKNITPFCHQWDEQKSIPKELWKKCFEAGWMPGVVGPPWPVEYVGSNIAGGIKPEEFDTFHELIMGDELARCGSGGVLWALSGGLTIGLPPIMYFGSDYLKQKVVGPCLKGDKVICLAITEPYAGSDVARLQTTAKKTPDGKHYILNGEKKWITNGVFADYFTVAARTGDEGMAGVSLLLVEKTMPGIKTTQMKCSGVWPSGTTYIIFEDVLVPVENLIGEENMGFLYIMYNFNHERWSICVSAARFARVCFEEAFKYAHKRKTFGKRLIDHPVIRFKFAHMARQIEATHSWIENITYQMKVLDKKMQARVLGGPIALLKAQCTQLFEFCAREASQIFGGLSYTRGGQGEKVERLSREVRAYTIPGGSEEIMLDLGIRMAMKRYAKSKV